MNTRILLVDDHAILLDGLEALLEQRADFHIVAKIIKGQYALAYLRKEPVELLITDYSMPDISGLELIREAKKIAPELKTIILSMHDEAHIVQEVISAGADAYILKKYAQQELLQAITIIQNGGNYWSPEINKILVRAIKKEDSDVWLSERELEVLKLLIQELTSKEIAQKLFISERTIETHRKNLLRKTNSSNTVGLIKYAYANKLI
ncbi:MAG TPA: response regulator transcription factor [Daejeonella sp.]|nr:response regulator transcription factor [Daejeonella sp.]